MSTHLWLEPAGAGELVPRQATPRRTLHMALNGAATLRVRVLQGVTVTDRAWADSHRLDYDVDDATTRADVFRSSAPGIVSVDPTVPPPAGVPPFITLRARAAGVANIDVGVREGGARPSGGRFITYQHTGIARVMVHEHIDDWWFGCDALTVPRFDSRAHTQVPIYAHFRDPANPTYPEFGDITGHGYVTLTSSAPGTCRLSPDGAGWLIGVADGTTEIEGSFLGTTARVPVSVTNPYGEPATTATPTPTPSPVPILEAVRPIGPPSERTNIVFVAEGYRADQRSEFNELVAAMADTLLTSPRHSPFKELASWTWRGRPPPAGQFNIFKAFTPTFLPAGAPPALEGGISEEDVAGQPEHADARLGTKTVPVMRRNSAIGLMHPLGSRPSTVPVVGDPLRFPRGVAWRRALAMRLAALAYPPLAGTPEYRVGRFWDVGGKDYGLACFLVSDDQRMKEQNVGAGVVLGAGWYSRAPDYSVAFDAPQKWRVRATHLTVAGLPSPARRRPSYATQRGQALADVLAHEFGHSMVLGDEYAGGGTIPIRRWEGEGGRILADPGVPFDNLVRPTDVCAGAPPALMNAVVRVNPLRAPWATLHRVERSERVWWVSWAVTPSSVTAVVDVYHGDPTTRWDRIRRNRTPVYLRELLRHHVIWHQEGDPAPVHLTRQLPSDALAADQRFLLLDKFTITRFLPIDASAPAGSPRRQRVTVELETRRADLPASLAAMPDAELLALLRRRIGEGAAMFVPKMRDGRPLLVIDQEVIDYMNRDGAPLHRSVDSLGRCADPAYSEPHLPPADLFAVSRRRMPSHAYKVVGLYEGGDHSSCNVYRPCGFCKMRSSSPVPFGPFVAGTERPSAHPQYCFVCKYLIVNRINPVMLERIERAYPEAGGRGRGRR